MQNIFFFFFSEGKLFTKNPSFEFHKLFGIRFILPEKKKNNTSNILYIFISFSILHYEKRISKGGSSAINQIRKSFITESDD